MLRFLKQRPTEPGTWFNREAFSLLSPVKTLPGDSPEELSDVLQRISAFLLSLSDDSTPSDGVTTAETATGKKHAGLDAVGLNKTKTKKTTTKKKMPTVQITV
ncbi:hypothetical protein DPEC_G00066070 [Dallia pectoralis]|uniref:Uncharacterized protein n=1 Tax=Dallia pectoralis TaxID=75939 RepID=A0ACC2H8L7_DALPE|nr:hypothetical protein DPEC_G00066070 [Dallia pectoralis]